MSRTNTLILVILLIISSLVLLCSVIDDTSGTDEEETNGECGENLKWTYSDGKLSISGNGAMADYSDGNNAPWSKYIGEMTYITIGSGVTKIGSYAFNGCASVRTIELPSSLTHIGAYSFKGCSNLTELVIPPAVTSINSNSFYGCSGVTSLKYQTKLCNDFNEYSSPFSSLGSSKGVSVTITDGVNRIPAYLLYGNTNVKSVRIPYSIDTYGTNCFKGCTGMSTVIMSYNDAEIESGAFSGCTGIKKIYYYTKSTTDFTTTNSPLMSIPSTEFELEIGGVTTYVPGNLAYMNTKLISVTFTGSVQKIGANAFNGCTSLRHISIQSDLISIDTSAFNNCKNVQSLDYNAQNFSDVESSPFLGVYNSEENTTVTIGNSVERIPSHIFQNCSSYVFNSISPSVINIGAHAFENVRFVDLDTASNLTEIGPYSFSKSKINWTIPSTIKTIPDYAFYDTSGFLALADDSTLEAIGSCAFAKSRAIASITIPATVNNIGASAFDMCRNLLSVTYCTDQIGSFKEELNIFRVGNNNACFTFANTIVPDNILTNTTFAKIVIGDDVIKVGANAFKNTDYTTHISGFGADSKIQSIGEWAFANSLIKAIYLSDELQYVGAGAFSNCDWLTDVYYLAKNSTIAFGKSLLTTGPIERFTWHISDDVKTIPANAFTNASICEVFLNNVKSIGSNAFSKTQIKSLVVPASVEIIEEAAFSFVPSLTKITFLNGETTIGKNAFIVDEKYIDTQIKCYRKAEQTEYRWTNDSRDPHFTYVHQEGEYSGMMETLFNLFSPIFGFDLTNEVIDFFIDPYSLKTIESINMGSEESNLLLLILIAIILLGILFISLYIDKDETVRLVEIILTFATIATIVFSIVRRAWTSPDYMDWAVLITFLILIGTYAPIKATYAGITKKRLPYYGEYLIKLYTQDIQEFKDSLLSPWIVIRDIVKGLPHNIVHTLLIFTVPGGLLLSFIYSISLFVYHIPAMIFSKILTYLFVRNDMNTKKHTNQQICPKCGNKFLRPIYVCHVCGIEHKNIMPGKYGIHECTCACGNKIPCTIRGKRWAHSYSKCPVCNEPLQTEESEPFSFAMIGAPGSGKTTFIACTANAFMHEVCPNNELDSKAIGPCDIERLITEMKNETKFTADGKFNSPYCIKFQPQSTSKIFRTPKALYLFDYNGHEFIRSNNMNVFEACYPGLEGAILMINPFDIPEFAMANGKMPKDEYGPDEILASFSRMYTEIVGIGPTEKIDIPIAILITRCSEIGLEQNISAVQSGPIDSESIIRFLEEYGQHNFINEISTRFANARYFTIDLEKDTNNSYIVPLAWLMCTVNPDLNKAIQWLEEEQ